jgi:hypothetical protein
MYDRARELMAGGMPGKTAFEKISGETGISAGTVQAAYYREAKRTGVVVARPRGAAKPAAAPPPKKRGRPAGSKSAPKAAAAAPAAAAPSASIATKLEQAARLLAEVASDVRALEADAARWRTVSALVKG